MEALERFRRDVRTKDREVFSESAAALRAWMIEKDPYYPTYHFVGPESWINDPNGPIFFKGRYHLFYQFDPIVDGERSKRCWGHAVSDDLVRWEDWPVAIWPDSPGDRKGVFSGNTFVTDGGVLNAIYTGVHESYASADGREPLCGIWAVSEDDGLTWRKKLVMSDEQRPNDSSPVHWDGYVWRDGDRWHQLVGGRSVAGDGATLQGAAWLWSSTDLEDWKLEGNIASDIRLTDLWESATDAWELPYVIRLDGKDVLLVGNKNNPYWLGQFDQGRRRFLPDDPAAATMDRGNYYSFNLNMSDDRAPGGSRRQLMHGWVTGPATPTREVPYWQGMHSIPRVINVRGDRVWQEPIPEIASLRRSGMRIDSAIASGRLAVEGDALEIQATFVPGDASVVGLKLLVSPEGDDFVRVFFDTRSGEFGVDGPTIKNRVPGPDEKHWTERVHVATQPAFLEPGDDVTMHIFLDRSAIEVFINGCAYTARVFAPKGARGVELFSDGSASTVRDVDVWAMGSLWERP